MKKRLSVLALTAVVAGSLAACGGSGGGTTTAAPAATQAPERKSGEESEAATKAVSEAASSQSGSGRYELALVIDLGTVDDKLFNQGAWEGLKKYAEEGSISYKYYQSQEGTMDSYLETIGLAIKGGAGLVVCPGFLFEEPIFIAQDKHSDIHLILPDGEPHDADYNHRTGDNVMPILFQEDQAGFLAGYAVVKGGYTKIGSMGGMAVPAVIRSGCGFVQGAECAAEEDGVTGIEIMYNYTGGFAVTPEAQSMTASWYQNGTEVIFGCGGVVGNFVMAATQEKNAKVTGVDVDQSSESETVITLAMKPLSNSVYDGVKDFYDGSLLGSETPVFTVVNNSVGLPMDTSEFEKSTQKQYDAIYKKLTDGGITLVQPPQDSNNPTMNLTSPTNSKVILIE